EQPLRRRARLPGPPECGVDDARHRAIEITVGADDGRGDAAELERDGAKTDVALQPLADVRAAGERVEPDLLVLHEPAAHVAAGPLHEIDVRRREARLE